jgi:hypothetical protein
MNVQERNIKGIASFEKKLFVYIWSW